MVKSVKENESELNEETKKSRTLRIKKFNFVMIMFLLVFLTAGITVFALSFGEDKADQVGFQDRKEFNKLYNVYDQLNKGYFQNLDQEKLINGAIDGMVQSLDDPYSDYMSKEESELFQESISASFEGIGAEIQERDGTIVVVSPIKGSPAEKVGLRPNDKILEVDEKNIQGMSANEAVLLIRGKKGTKVTLTIARNENEEPIKVPITRDEIPINTVYAEMLDHGVAKIQITNFSTHTDKDLEEALKEMEEQGMKSLIVDLRKNPGGLLDQAINISNLFVPEGKQLFQVAYKSGKVEEFISKGGEKLTLPIVMLIDEGSASASEILAAAVKESTQIPLVGEKSFGKGTVQTTEQFNDGSNLKYTMAKWLTPKGNWVHEKGIEPDVSVSLPEYASLPYISPENELKVDSTSLEVKAAEEFLHALGYNAGHMDSYYDEHTAEAVKKFQQDEGLDVTGVLTGETTIALMNKIQELLQENDPQVEEAVKLLTEQME